MAVPIIIATVVFFVIFVLMAYFIRDKVRNETSDEKIKGEYSK